MRLCTAAIPLQFTAAPLLLLLPVAMRCPADGPGGPRARELQQDDLPQLPYLNAVIDETMRMYPVAATASVRYVPCAFYHVPCATCQRHVAVEDKPA